MKILSWTPAFAGETIKKGVSPFRHSGESRNPGGSMTKLVSIQLWTHYPPIAKISLPESGRPIRKGLGAGPFGAGEALNA